jgi:beta-glucosidase
VFDAEGQLVKAAPGVPVNQMGDEIYPVGLGSTIREAARVARVPVYVTENGLATTDDTQRVTFLEDSVEVVAGCIADGVDVRGYIVWTLLDNFEWIFGFEPKFGLVAVDRATQERTPKPSAYRLGELARSYS